MDYQKPDGDLVDFINGEDRYADLKMIDPAEAAILQPRLARHCDYIYDLMVSSTKLFTPPLQEGKKG